MTHEPIRGLPPGMIPVMGRPPPPSKAELDEAATVRGLQLRTNSVAYAVQSLDGRDVTTEELLARAKAIAAYIEVD